MSTLEQSGNALDSGRGREAHRIRVGFIVGPTGAGKSALAMQVAGRLGAEIINADSRQFYRGLDIGTAKPSPEERRRILHHLIDVRTPDRPLDVAEFGALARSAIADIAARGSAPRVVGGSGLYLRVLRGGIFPGPPASPDTRAHLAGIAAARGVPYLHSQLAEIDPEAAARIGHNDLYRIVRALEVYEATGEPISRHQRRHAFAGAGYDTLVVGIAPERKLLYDAIDRRFDAMVAAGFIDEVRGLLAQGCSPEAPPLKTIGYRQIAAFVRGELTLDEAIALAKRDSRRLAKRQMTWFRRDPEIHWLDPSRAAQQALDLFERFFSGATGH